MVTLLQVVLYLLFAADTIIFILPQIDPDFFVIKIPYWANEQDSGQYSRLVGVFFLLLGIVKLHGANHLHEKV